jgi:23S rRNA pseudouridine2605 synthase|tara:strand:+ start:18283 stop:19422 length:1140 start_codon:yes stop_codon:yes gene_type:complete
MGATVPRGRELGKHRLRSHAGRASCTFLYGGAPAKEKPMTPRSDSSPSTPEGDRIAKVIARAGICSRREAEKLIEEGRVTVNGKVLKSPALNVTGRETIIVDGKVLPSKEPTRLWRYHKPAGLVTTAKDPEGRTTVFEKLPDDIPRVVSVGRLDINTEGLLLLTNDGDLARLLELPATGWTRRYRVRAWGRITQADLDKLKNGITVEGVRYGPIEAVIDKVQGSNVWLTLSLKEGKNREVKRVLAELGLSVNRLIRLSFGPFQIGDLEPGDIKLVPQRVLMDQLGAHAEQFAQPEARPARVPAGKPDHPGKGTARPKSKAPRPHRAGTADKKAPTRKGPPKKSSENRSPEKKGTENKKPESKKTDNRRKAPHADRRRRS